MSDQAPVSRRQALRAGGMLGLAAVSVALLGAVAQAATAPVAGSPDPIGPYGRSAAGDIQAHRPSRVTIATQTWPGPTIADRATAQ